MDKNKSVLDSEDQIPAIDENENGGYGHRFKKLKPESWKNIPACVVNGFKLVIENAMSDSLQFLELNRRIEECENSTKVSIKKIK